MSENARPQHLLFKASISLGLLLGVLLLVDRVAGLAPPEHYADLDF